MEWRCHKNHVVAPYRSIRLLYISIYFQLFVHGLLCSPLCDGSPHQVEHRFVWVILSLAMSLFCRRRLLAVSTDIAASIVLTWRVGLLIPFILTCELHNRSSRALCRILVLVEARRCLCSRSDATSFNKLIIRRRLKLLSKSPFRYDKSSNVSWRWLFWWIGSTREATDGFKFSEADSGAAR